MCCWPQYCSCTETNARSDQKVIYSKSLFAFEVLCDAVINQLRQSENQEVHQALKYQSSEALIEATEALFPPDGPETVRHAIVPGAQRHDPRARVQVIDDGARALNVQTMQHSFQGIQHHIRDHQGREVRREFWEIRERHAGRRRGLVIVSSLVGGGSVVQAFAFHVEQHEVLEQRLQQVSEQPVQHCRQHDGPHGQQAAVPAQGAVPADHAVQAVLQVVHGGLVVWDALCLWEQNQEPVTTDAHIEIRGRVNANFFVYHA